METKTYHIEISGESYGSPTANLTHEEYIKFKNILYECSSEYIDVTIEELPDISKIYRDLIDNNITDIRKEYTQTHNIIKKYVDPNKIELSNVIYYNLFEYFK